ncbi:MAG: DUF2071 domain-containing protein [Flavobacteriaceae bacterium]|nr:DUF2071 domain-containing protein [Flavobacteriaceae bacterium]
MSEVKEIMKFVAHRPWGMPKEEWVYYQEWNRLLFFHFEVSFEVLRTLVPEELEIDALDGKCYVSLVPFTMENIRPRGLPAVGFISNFEELNVRTYVKKEGKTGVYFLNIEAGKSLSAYVSRKLSGLPYEKAIMQRKEGYYSSCNPVKDFSFEAKYRVGSIVQEKTPLQIWLTERYCLYVFDKNKLYRYQIHHKEWEIKEIMFDKLSIDYVFGGMRLTEDQVLCPNYSDGIVVVSWGREQVK